MIDSADTYLDRIEKKIDKLTSRLFMVPPPDRVERGEGVGRAASFEEEPPALLPRAVEHELNALRRHASSIARRNTAVSRSIVQQMSYRS